MKYLVINTKVRMYKMPSSMFDIAIANTILWKIWSPNVIEGDILS